MGGAGDEEVNHLEQIIGRFHDLPYSGKSFNANNRYSYDSSEQLQTTQQVRPAWGAAQVENLRYDKAGNLFDGAKLNGLIKHNLVVVYQDKRYRYDRFGRLCEKRIGSNRVQRFEYDAEHRLVCVEQERFGERERVVFGYDPLGRRISKEVYKKDYPEPVRRTLFHWQGLRLLQEVQSRLHSLYIYASPGSYEPLARIDGRPGQEKIQYFHTNLAGLPEQLTDAEGNSLWRSDYQGWGTTREEWHSPRQSREQNLRYQGQYLDRETGLHYNMFRYYDSDIGRFTQTDPIGLMGGLNLYYYAPNTIFWIDPLGLDVVRLRHYTSNQGFAAIQEGMKILPGDQNAVFAFRAKGKPLSMADAAEKFIIKQNHARNYIDFDIDTNRAEFRKNDLGVEEYKIKGEVVLDKKTTKFNKRC
jgi:RHS repeat-associated protein